MAKREYKTQVPGKPAVEVEAAEVVDPVADEGVSDGVVGNTVAVPTPENKTDQAPATADFDALVAAAVEKKFREMQAAKVKAEQAELPDQADVDATELKRAVLTKQGYVVPAPRELMAEHKHRI